MKLGIMQPYFFPYLGYFDLINYVDKWVVFDTAQYIRHGWVNRNRVLHPNEGWMYITVPVKDHKQDTAIKEVKIANQKDWKESILGKLAHYKNSAPYAEDTFSLVKECMEPGEDYLSNLNVKALKKVCERLNIDFEYSIFSNMDLELGKIEGPEDWALRISEAMGADEYANLPGGDDLFNESDFQRSDIKLIIRELPTFEYDCNGFEFVPDLSIIDVMMWNQPEEIKEYLDSHK